MTRTPRKPPEEALATLSDEQRAQLEAIERRAIYEFHGNLDELERALGMLRLGHHFGWKVLTLTHSKPTIRKYEHILGIDIKELFPEVGPGSYRSIGLKFAQKVSNFWKVVSGDIKIEGRKDITK